MPSESSVALEGAELQRREVQVVLDAERSQLHRNRLGQFATPADLASDVTSYCLSLMEPTSPIRFLEPAIGSGSFYSALLRQVTPGRLESAVGVEIDPRFVTVARRLWGDHGLLLIEGDFTREAPHLSPCNLLITNPPYVRHHHLAGPDKERLRASALGASGLDANGLSGLYVYFMLIANGVMDEGSLAAWLIPSEFMDVNYGEVLRRYLSHSIELVRIHRFDPEDVQFDDALVSSAVVVFRRRKPDPTSCAEFSYGGTVTAPRLVEKVPIASLKASRKWTSFPRNGQEYPVDKTVTLSDLFTVRRGIATGANDFFVIARERAVGLNLPEEFLRPILPSPRRITTQVIEREADGYPVVAPSLVLIDCDLPEEDVRTRYPTLWEYFSLGATQGIREGYLIKNRKPWYRQERREPAPFLCTYMGRATTDDTPFRFIWNRSDAIATNVFLMLYPKPALRRTLDARPDLTAVVHELLTELRGSELREEGRVYGGGLHKIEPAELGRISVSSMVAALPELAEQPEIRSLLTGEGSSGQLGLGV